MLKLGGAVYLGWALGANDAANIFGPAVASRAVRYRTAMWTAAVLVVCGAALGGHEALQSVARVGEQTPISALVVSVTAAAAMTGLIVLRMPASSSQAVLGAIVGVGLARGSSLDPALVMRLVFGWLLTPLLGALLSFVFYTLVSLLLRRRTLGGLETYDQVVRGALWSAGAWGAFALGANNAANVTGVFVASGSLAPAAAVWVAGGSIALGMLTFGQRMMHVLGSRLVQLEPQTALIAMLGQAIAVHVFALHGLPVSSSQALAGAVLGIGLAKGVRTIDPMVLVRVVSGWFVTPAAGGLLGWSLARVLLPG
jgi:PiT family inorganic phosphate transporter